MGTRNKPRRTHPGEKTGTDPLCPVCGFVCACACHWDDEDGYREALDIQLRMDDRLAEKDEEIDRLRGLLGDVANLLAPAVERLMLGRRSDANWEAVAEAIVQAADLLPPAGTD